MTTIDPHAHDRGSKWPAVTDIDDDTAGLADDCPDGGADSMLALADQRTRPGRRNVFMRLIQRGRTVAEATTLPGADAEALAVATQTARTVHHGKGLRVESGADWEAHITHEVVAEFRRPRKFICWCGQPAPLMFEAITPGGEPIRRCLAHPNPRTFAIVRTADGGTDGAA
jgi:hypothetical protein